MTIEETIAAIHALSDNRSVYVYLPNPDNPMGKGVHAVTGLTTADLKALASLAEDALRYEKMMGETVSMVFTEGIAIAHLDSDIWALNHKWADQTFDTALDAFESLAGKEGGG